MPVYWRRAISPPSTEYSHSAYRSSRDLQLYAAVSGSYAYLIGRSVTNHERHDSLAGLRPNIVTFRLTERNNRANGDTIADRWRATRNPCWRDRPKEPAKKSLKGEGSFWSGREDLNLRPLRPERSALPGCATPRPGGSEKRKSDCLTREG